MYHIRLFLCVVMLFVISAFTLPFALADDASQVGITVTGNASVKAKPDIAYVTFGVSVQDVDAAKAARENAQKTTSVIDAIVKFGIPKSDIETIQYSVSPVMDYEKNPPVNVGYVVSNQVRVTVRDLTKIGPLIDTAINAGANNVQGVLFTIEDNTKLQLEALAKAAKNAEEKAKVLADALGVKLGKAKFVSESGGYTPRPMEYVAMKAADAAPTPIIPGDVETSMNVTVSFMILY